MNDIKLDFDDVLIVPRRSIEPLTRKGVNIKISWLDTNAYPIVIANMPSTGTYEIAKHLTPLKVFTFIHKEYGVEEHKINLATMDDRRYIAITSGVQAWDIERTIDVISDFPDIGIINVDIANVYANVEGMIETIKKYRTLFPHIKISAGNICDKSLMEKLVNAGADYIKVGIGSGAACTTRTEVGVGVPQLSAVIECADAAHGLGAHIIADGGCNMPGDLAKAFGAGADFVMLGGMLTGYDETDGNIIEENGKKYKIVYGMSSDTAQKKYYNKVYTYRASEGRTTKVLYKEESVQSLIQEVLGGLRSACAYIGATTLKNIPKCTTFIRVNNQINTSLITPLTTLG